MFLTTLVTIVKRWILPNCKEQMNGHRVFSEYPSAIEKKEILTQATIQRSLEDMKPGERQPDIEG